MREGIFPSSVSDVADGLRGGDQVHGRAGHLRARRSLPRRLWPRLSLGQTTVDDDTMRQFSLSGYCGRPPRYTTDIAGVGLGEVLSLVSYGVFRCCAFSGLSQDERWYPLYMPSSIIFGLSLSSALPRVSHIKQTDNDRVHANRLPERSCPLSAGAEAGYVADDRLSRDVLSDGEREL